eukprot:Gb_11947 [translate_table: standard]
MDSEPSSDAFQMSSTDLIRQRLVKCGVPNDYVEQLQPGLVAYVRRNKSKLRLFICALLPGPEEVNELTSSAGSEEVCQKIKDQFRESMKWVQWLMFEEEPQAVLKELGKQSSGTRGVCGAVWGDNDIAYRCRTCEHDPTCAICVPCFQAGNHVNHDYSMIHTGGGCCDCGDETAWKPEGFCARHRGPGQVQPLPTKFTISADPVLGALLLVWKERLVAAESVAEGRPKKWEQQTLQEKVASKTSSAIVEMLLGFCKCSESLLNFTATMMGSSPAGLLDILLRTERFVPKKVVAELHELLFKLLGEPNFKYEFAKAFIKHYPTLISEAIRKGIDGSNSSTKSSDYYPVLSNFSVQIFTVPTLTPRLVIELKLLDMLLGSLKQFFVSCAGEDGRLLASKGPISNQHYIRLIEDIRYVMSHLEVAKYVARERPDLSKAWLQLLEFIQGMGPQKRVTSIHVEEENDQWLASFILEIQMANIHSLYVAGAVSVYDIKWMEDKTLYHISTQDDSDDDGDVVRHAKIGRLSEESSVGRMAGRSSGSDPEIGEACPESTCNLHGSGVKSCSNYIDSSKLPIPSSLIWLISECLKALDNWLGVDTAKDLRKPKYNTTEFTESSLTRRAVQWRGRGGRGLIRDMNSVEPAPRGADTDTNTGRGGVFREIFRRGRRIALADARTESETDEDRTARRPFVTNDNFPGVSEMNIDTASIEDFPGDSCLDLEVESLGVLRLEEWPVISYDVSQQDISFHIPLHRMLSLSLHKAMELYTGKLDQHHSEMTNNISTASFSGSCREFFGQLLGKCHPCGFSAFVMEHPLRLKVFCAQVRAGMWRRNGHSTLSLCEYYHSVRWCEDSLELDVFLLQCCAALAPPEAFVQRIQERFGLSDYLSLDLIRSNEYEPMLVQEMLALIIRIVAERGFCGLSVTETLRRELIRRLAVGDATHSQLLKALPPRLLDNKNLQETLDTVATYSRPSGMQQGKYSLRKDYWQELDLYHPRWNSRDLQVAEERYSRFCKGSAMVMQLPRWRKPFQPLNNISQIATSRGVLQIIRSVLFYAVFSENSSESRAPDGVLFTALHLLGLGLDICSLKTNKNVQNGIMLPTTLSEQNDFTSIDARISCDNQEPPPLLDYAKEVVYVGGINKPGASKHQSMLSLLVLLMRKYESGSEQGIAAESSHCNIASLIQSFLEKFAELHCGCMYEIEKLVPSIVHRLSLRGERHSAVKGSDNPETPSYPSDVEKKRALARERQAAVMAKMKAAQAKFVASLNPSDSVEVNASEANQGKSFVETEEASEDTASVVCSLCRESGCKSPTAFLTLVQKSRLLSFAERGPPSWENGTQKNGDDPAINDRGAEAYGSALDSGSGEMIPTVELWHLIQNALDGVNRDGPLEVEGLFDILRIQLPVNTRNVDRHIVSDDSNANLLVSADTGEDDSVIEEDADSGRDVPIRLFSDSCSDSAALVRKGMVGSSEDAISTVLTEYVAAISRVMSEQQPTPENSSEVLGRGSSALSSQALTFDGFGPNDCDGVHVSSCGHAVHQECLDRYLSSLRQRYSSRIIFEGVHIVDPDQGEFLCPVCRRLANSVLPVLPVGSRSDTLCKQAMLAKKDLSPSRELPTIASAGWQKLRLPEALSLLQNAEELAGKRGFRKAVSWQLPEITKSALESLFHNLYTMYFPGKSITKPASGRINQSLLLWDVLRYSLLSSELAARSAKLDAVARGSGTNLETLYRAVNCSKGSVLSLLLLVAEATQSQNRLTVLLRSRGMQLLVGAISCGVSRDTLSENSSTGNISSLLDHIDKGKDFPDIHFWRRTADPVLVHDPFSSLVWVLFCLPLHFQSTMEPFTSLVHLFYLVCLVQVIAYTGRSILPEGDFKSVSYSFIKRIVATVSGTVLSQSSLETDDVDLFSCPIKLLIRRLTLPYLRRCALLYKLLNFSSSAHPQEGVDGWERSTVHMVDDYRKTGEEILIELEELQQLEQLFQIPSLETILEDKNVHILALKWCQHVSKETGSRPYRHVVRPLLARPFELMRLPHIYQDLLQRYIKECCPACKSVPDQPALCLLCGTLCCAPSRRPCRQNECYQHAMACGAGIGVFLMIRRTNVLLQRSARQAPWPSPYLDAFGEEDFDMQRGKPLYLSKERYAALTHMVVSHGLDHSSHVLHQTTRDTVFII